MTSFPSEQQSRTSTAGEDGAGQTENAAACDARITATSADSKRNQAISQAIRLGSETSWSERLSPRPHYGRIDEQNMQLSEEDEQVDMRYELTADGVDPPPAYTIIMAQQQSLTRSDEGNRRVNGETWYRQQADRDEEEDEGMYNSAQRPTPPSVHALDESTPLLTESIHTAGDSPSSWWFPPLQRQQKTNALNRQRLHCATLFSAIVAVLLICTYLATARRDLSFNHTPPLPTTTYVPTDRVYERHETIGDITGGYWLYDRLSLSTTAGDIDIELDPQSADDPLHSDTDPALLFLSSDLGNINLRLANNYISNSHRPSRPILVEIHTFAGQVTAQLPLTQPGSLEISTSIGQQILNIFSIDANSTARPRNVNIKPQLQSNITTRSSTGTQHLTLHALNPYQPITALTSLHHSLATADLKLKYPDTWLGIVDATAGAPINGFTVSGDDLVYTAKDNYHVRARRGRDSDDALVQIRSDGTGAVEFEC